MKPLIKEANMLPFDIKEITGKKDNDISMELDAVNVRFASFMATAVDSKHITEAEVEGFADKVKTWMPICAKCYDALLAATGYFTV